MPTRSYADALVHTLFQQAQGFVGVYDAQLSRFTRVNAKGVQLLGFATEQALLDAPALPIRPATLESWETLLEAAQQHHYVVDARIELPGRPAVDARLELTHFEHEGRSLFLVGLHEQEQGRLQRAERELAQSVGRFEAVVANATIGIVVCDRQGVIISANRLSQQLFGYAEGELPGQKIEVLVPNAAGRRHEQLRESFNANPSVRAMGAHRAGLEALRKDGSVFPVEVSLSYFYLDDELYVVSYILDITYKKEAERELIAQRQRVEGLNAELEQKVADRTHALLSTLEQLEQRTEELAKALAAEQELGELKSRFVSMASHEFRTPLTAVMNSATLIEKYPGADQQDKRVKHLQRIRASVKHLNDILEEFLSVGRIEEGRIEARPADLDFGALLADTVADVQSLLKPGQIIEQRTECPAPVHLDSSLLRKILVNLLSNAIKYSGDNSVVTVRTACTGGHLTLTVQDQGVGISQEDQEHLFERFFRARNVTNVPGTGLGLYIIAKYLELMNGRIELLSELGQGTTVTVTIPYENHPAD
ncbi:PAS domain S-box protein [Hymenobacter busanensis]|uniref:histidine kinase n=1 Tax=Hymenobacter busanensis TaxID=2607656 RepID=A0A7L4ZSR8_9BACT|nr:PAS domain-containing sensor histidine kinase [Hymenobacter busanensis]KAA9327683.1 PAS domain S-box protein [Hymenobacter busanensis]QHJ05977.1 PAS domain S-box protein [Hymenobacter busanensis]